MECFLFSVISLLFCIFILSYKNNNLMGKYKHIIELFQDLFDHGNRNMFKPPEVIQKVMNVLRRFL